MMKYIKCQLVVYTSHSMYVEISMRIKLLKLINFLMPNLTVTYPQAEIIF